MSVHAKRSKRRRREEEGAPKVTLGNDRHRNRVLQKHFNERVTAFRCLQSLRYVTTIRIHRRPKLFLLLLRVRRRRSIADMFEKLSKYERSGSYDNRTSVTTRSDTKGFSDQSRVPLELVAIRNRKSIDRLTISARFRARLSIMNRRPRHVFRVTWKQVKAVDAGLIDVTFRAR